MGGIQEMSSLRGSDLKSELSRLLIGKLRPKAEIEVFTSNLQPLLGINK